MNIENNLLNNYFSMINNETISGFLQCKYCPVDFNKSDSNEELWRKHDESLKNMSLSDIISDNSLLDLKIELAERIFNKCHFCENNCNVNRRETNGYCNLKESRINSEFLHMGEEDVLIPSHTIFFTGCTLKCVFCQNWDISQRINGFYITPFKIAEIINHRYKQGARNINWVGGDPTPNLVYILKSLKKINVNLPQIWNSNMYCSIDTMRLLNGIIDVFLTDFKFGNNTCAKRLCKGDNYFNIVKRNHKIAYGYSEMIIRHLVLPNHNKCCSEPILKWIKQNIPNVLINIMKQYHPDYQADKYYDISTKVSSKDYQNIIEYAKKLNLFLI